MGWVVNATPRPLYPRKRPDTHCIGDWVGPRAGLDGCGKYRPPPEFDPRTVQPLASRYADYASPAPTKETYYVIIIIIIIIILMITSVYKSDRLHVNNRLADS
jgi:hypothetical protein